MVQHLYSEDYDIDHLPGQKGKMSDRDLLRSDIIYIPLHLFKVPYHYHYMADQVFPWSDILSDHFKSYNPHWTLQKSNYSLKTIQ